MKSDIPGNWEMRTLRELNADSVVSLTPAEYPDETFEYYSIPAYQDGKRPIQVAGKDILSQKLEIPAKCLLFGKLNPRVEKIWNVESTASLRRLASTEWLPIIPSAELDQAFGYFLLWSDWVLPIAKGLTSGSTPSRQRVESASFYQIQVPLPPIDEQRAIARVLTRVATAVGLQDELIVAATDLKRAAMQALFTRGLRRDEQIETEIGAIPARWAVTDLRSIRAWLQYGTSARCVHLSNGSPVLRIPNVAPGRVDAADLKYAQFTPEEEHRYRLEEGDLLFIRTNGVVERLGTCAVYAGEPSGALFASYLIRARLKLNRVDPYFIAHFLGSELGTRLIAARATPAADGKYNLNTTTIDSLPIPLPPTLDEQHEIVAILDAIDAKIDLHRRKRAVLDDLFKALLHKLMTGEIRVADLDLSALSPAPEQEVAT